MKQKITMLLMLFVLGFGCAFAQQQITGKVVDKAGEPIIGASIVLKSNPQIGVTSDLNGGFSLSVSEGKPLIISFVGMKTQELVALNGMRVVLLADDKLLEDVVVTALGIKRSEKALSYNVQKISNEDLTTVKSANFMNSLNGKVAGVDIQTSASGIGGATRVIMRGAKSIQGNNNVLYVIDGMPMNNQMGKSSTGVFGGMTSTEGISDLNPEDIESISALTGPSAAALYGSSAANGVVLITTKKGKEGKMTVTISNTTEFSNPFVTPQFQNTYGYSGSYQSWGEKLLTPSTYNPLDFFRTGTNVMNGATITMGSKNNQTFISGATTNSRGIVPNNEYNRYNISLRNSTLLLNDKLHLDASVNYIKESDQNMIGQGLYFNPLVTTYLFPPSEDFNAIRLFERYDNERKFPVQFWPYGDLGLDQENPYWMAHRMLFPSKKDRYMLYGSVQYDFADWINVAARIRQDNTYKTNERKFYASTDGTHAGPNGNYTFSQDVFTQTYIDAMANINKSWNDFSLTANVGYSYSKTAGMNRGNVGDLLGTPNLFSLKNLDPQKMKIIEEVYGRDMNIAVFANAELAWRNMLYLTLTGRNDWNSHLVNSEEPSYFYPSVGLSALISEMLTMPDWLTYLKVRGSYTEVGAPISQLGLTPRTVTYPIAGGAVNTISSYPYPEFKAERTRSYEVGLNARFLQNRINFNLTLYQSDTYNQTFFSEAPPTSGYSGFYLQAGRVNNKGIEMSLGYDDNFGNFGYATNFTYTLNRNKIVRLVHDYVNPIDGSLLSFDEITVEGNRIREGGAIGDIYVDQVLAEDFQGNILLSPTGEMSLMKRTIKVGNSNPNFTLGWRNDFSWKGVNLGLLFTGRFGGVVTSSTQALMDQFGVSKATADARDAGGVMINNGLVDAKKYYQVIGGGKEGNMAYYTYNATNVRLQEASLGYTIPRSVFDNKLSLTVSAVGKNLWMIYNKAPFDPQLTTAFGTYGQGHDMFMLPSLRTIGFSVKAQF